MKPLFKTLVLALGLSSLAHAQLTTGHDQSGIRALGVQFHFDDAYVDSRIGAHAAVSGFADLFLSSDFTLTFRLEWWRTNKSITGETFEYKESIYRAQEPQSWNDFSLTAILCQHVSTMGTIGIGLGADLIKLRRISYRYPVFWVDFFKDNVYLVQSSVNDEANVLIRPSCCFTADLEWPLSPQFYLLGQVEYKLCFVGRNYSYTTLNSLNSYGISVGIAYCIH